MNTNGPLDPCPVCEAYNEGRADERAAIVAWLRDTLVDPHLPDRIERGEHER